MARKDDKDNKDNKHDKHENDMGDDAILATFEVELAHGRWRNGFWALVSLLAAGFFVLRMGSFGMLAGGAILVSAWTSVKGFVLTLVHPAGSIVIRETELVLPRGLCAGDSLTMPLADLRHAYLLRRFVPWNATAPILVVETNRGTFEYPRDWFAVDQDQRRISTALNRRLGLLS